MLTFLVKKWFSLMVFPLSQSILLFIFALVLFWRSSRRLAVSMVCLALMWLWTSSTAIFADWLLVGLERNFEAVSPSDQPNADAIVLLGGATAGLAHDGDMGNLNDAADRLLTALSLFRASKAPLIVITGGSIKESPSEASIMRDMLELMGIPSDAILLEEKALDTKQNALFTADVLYKINADKILLVTSAYHMRRATFIFNEMLSDRVEVIPAASDHQRSIAEPILPRWMPSVGDLFRTSVALKEIVGFWFYRATLIN